MRTGVHIGAMIDQEGLEALTNAMVRIMQAGGDQETARAAIAALGNVAKVENVYVGDVTLHESG